MGNLVSLLNPRLTNPPENTQLQEDLNTQDSSPPLTESSRPSVGRSPRPTYISFPSQTTFFGALSLSPAISPTPSPSQRENPFERPLLSPALSFYTAPSSPYNSPQIDQPPQNPANLLPETEIILHVPPPPTPPTEVPASLPPQAEPDTPTIDDEAFPDVDQMPVDPFLDEEGLSPLERVYLFSRSQATFHRYISVFIAHALPKFLEEINTLEAVEYVLPLLSGLAIDPEEQVKEALATELVPIIWWFFTHCQLTDDFESMPPDWSLDTTHHDATFVSVQTFTPILGTLLLSPNGMVCGPARQAVVELLNRIRKADERELLSPSQSRVTTLSSDEEDRVYAVGLFGSQERAIFREEILQQVVIGMGRLEDEQQEFSEQAESPIPFEETLTTTVHIAADESDPIKHTSSLADAEPISELAARRKDSVNPYFPPLPPSNPLLVPGSLAAPLVQASPIAQSSSTAHVSPAPTPTHPSVDVSSEPKLGSTSSLHLIHSSGQAPPDPPVPRQPNPYPSGADNEDHEVFDVSGDGEGDEQAAVGRLSSMSLMAAVAASGPLTAEMQDAFVIEVERISQDPIYWVRREASFALGALAKVVPESVVLKSLVLVFDRLRQDAVWNVRHSALFALPAILSRLAPARRRSVALEAIIPLASDEKAPVRLGALEALGEVLYTFHNDQEGPPEEILKLFLGRPEDYQVQAQESTRSSPVAEELEKVDAWGTIRPPFASQMEDLNTLAPPATEDSPIEKFYKDPARPLICAFNYPAVALTLGRARWFELRPLYKILSKDSSVKLRRTLAASLGELAQIIGPEASEQDLVHIWWKAIKSEDDSEVRQKAVEAVATLVPALGAGQGKEDVADGLLEVWRDGTLKGWREREVAVGVLDGLIDVIGEQKPGVIASALILALRDSVAGVREAAISVVPKIWQAFRNQTSALSMVKADIRNLAQSPTFRDRMTFITCQQVLIQGVDGAAVISTDGFWQDLSKLAGDDIIGVRIALARFVGILQGDFARNAKLPPLSLTDLIHKLSADPSKEVRSFVAPNRALDVLLSRSTGRTPSGRESSSTFSRPP